MNPFATLPTLLSTDRLCNLISYSQRAPEGLIAEFGLYQGGSLEVIAKYNPERAVYGIDSFQGLPAPSQYDTHHEGDFHDVDYQGITGYFKMLYPNVRILKGYSPNVFQFFDDHAQFAFCHIDVDLYESVKHAIDFFYPRMVEGGIMIFDDYGWSSTLGAKRAVDEWVEAIGEYLQSNRQEGLIIPAVATKLFYADGVSSKQFIVVK